jgi:hypothetical protein
VPVKLPKYLAQYVAIRAPSHLPGNKGLLDP